VKNKLLWRLCAFIAVGTVLLFWAIAWLTNHTETSMSFIDKAHQETLYSYGQEAEKIYLEDGEQALAAFLQEVKTKEDTWLAVVNSQMTTFANTQMLDEFVDRFQIGRSPEWKIHLYFSENPVMEVPFVDDNTHFLIQLPQRMRPGSLLLATRLTLQIALPLVILSLLSFMLYRHLMTPLKQLENATKDFANGNLEARAMAAMPKRNDELTGLAQTFDKMAQRTSSLIYNQRSLLADLSHELRTPLARIDMAIDFVEQDINREQALSRLRYEASTMRELVEDTLTFAWLNTESPQLNSDDFDLVELFNVICEDARFEYPDRTLHVDTPECANIEKSSQLALGQALENIIRNALNAGTEEREIAILTARAPEAEGPIRDYLDSIGLDTSMITFVLLGSSDPKDKADWIADRIESGANDVLFFDDSGKNVKAVESLSDEYPDVKIRARKVRYAEDLA